MFRRLRSTFMTLLLLLTCLASYSQAFAPYPTATLTVNGSETQPGGVWDNGNITIDFNGYVEIVNYGQYSSAASLASALGAMFTRDYSAMGLYAKAGAHGSLVDPTVVTFQLVDGNQFAPINIVDASPSFSFSPSGFASTATAADRGTATLTVAGTTVTASYGAGSTAATIAQDLALKANSPLVEVTAMGGSLYLQSKQATGSFSYPYGLSFSTGTSFSGSPGSGTLTSSSDAAPFIAYSYSVTNSAGQSGYDGEGNVRNVADSVMGAWSYTYDNLNRLTSGTPTSGPYIGQYICWSYDSFGNRTSQSVSPTPCTGTPPATFAASYSSNNRISSVSAPAGASITYDAAGNVTYDGYNHYTYDAEGRVCALDGSQGMMGYQYDSDGTRIGKGTVTNWQNCDITTNGYNPITDYVLDQGGGQMTEVAVGNGTATPVHTNVTANRMLIATFDSAGWHFHLNDALGSRRAQTDAAGIPEQTCQSLPFGDQLYCSGSLTSPTEHHFTGKERDTESGNDYFGARYYGSNMGRWMSPDPSGLAYADPTNPQSLNLYSYVMNRPLVFVDPNGLCGGPDDDDFYGCNVSLGNGKGYLLDQDNTRYDYSSQASVTVTANDNNPRDDSSRGIATDSVTIPLNGVPTLVTNTRTWNNPGAQGQPDATQLPSCYKIEADVVVGDLNPFSPGWSTATGAAADAAAAGSAYKATQAAIYAGTKINTKGGIGLISPLKSSTYRGMMAESSLLTKVSAVFTLGSLDVSLGRAMYAAVTTPCK